MNGAVRLWDTDTGVVIGDPLLGNSHFVFSVMISPDGRRIVSGSAGGTVRLWDAGTGVAICDPFLGHSDAVRSVAFSPDDHRIVSGSDDKTVRVWDVDTGTAISATLVGHSRSVMSVVFSPDGRYIASGSEDSTVRVWDAISTLSEWPPNVFQLKQYSTSKGWVSVDNHNLLFWLPAEYRRTKPDHSLFVITSEPVLQPVWLAYSQFAHGTGWTNISEAGR
jgi:WD40 repeat protein